MRDMEDGMNQTELVDLVKTNTGVGRETVRKAIDSLLGQKKLSSRDGDWPRSIVYSRTG